MRLAGRDGNARLVDADAPAVLELLAASPGAARLVIAQDDGGVRAIPLAD